MSILTLVLGESGTGKTRSVRYLNQQNTLLIQCYNKKLPFKTPRWPMFDLNTGTGSVVYVPKWQNIVQAINESQRFGKSIVVIDDFQYIMGLEFVRRANEGGWEKYSQMGQHALSVIDAAANIPGDTRFYFLSHTETEESGKTKIKTVGRMLDRQIVLEGLFPIVLKTDVQMRNYTFSTQNSGMDTVKSPEEMFQPVIENDLNFVDETICDYYGIDSSTTTNLHEFRR